MARRYTDAFKAEAVRQVEHGANITELARKLGISRTLLYRWIDQAQPAEPKKAREESELARLKREVADLREENSFLKKAAAYFAKERPRGTR